MSIATVAGVKPRAVKASSSDATCMRRARADRCALRPPRRASSTPSTCHCLGLFDGSRRRPRPPDLLRGASLPAPGAGALLAAVAAARTAARRSSSRTGLTRKRIGSSKSASSLGDRLLTQTIWRPGSRPRSSLASSRPAVSAGSSRRTSAVAVSALRRMTMGWWPRRATTAANSAAMSGSGSAIAIRAGDMAPRYPPPARPNPSGPRVCLRLGVDREHSPTSPEQLDGVSSRAAAEIDGEQSSFLRARSRGEARSKRPARGGRNRRLLVIRRLGS